MLAAAGLESTGCDQQHPNCGACGREEAVPGYQLGSCDRGISVRVTPTLKVWQQHMRDGPASVRTRSVSASTNQLRAWRGAGGTVVFGTDAGCMNDYDPSDEYALMTEAGMTFREPLAALTTTPAAILGRGRRPPGASLRATGGLGGPGRRSVSRTFEPSPTWAIRCGAERRFTRSAQWAWYYSA